MVPKELIPNEFNMTTFYSKILLFGEYGLLKGSMGLAMPYSKYFGKLIKPSDDTILNHKELDSNSVIKKLAIAILHQHPFSINVNIEQFLEDALLGLYFDSNIPKSYGVGSSGTLVAAIYHKYFYNFDTIDLNNIKKLKQIKNELAQIESYFHGKSSGIDPLVSFLNTPTLLNAPANKFNFEIPDNLKIFLIDTQQKSSTKDFVQIFNEKWLERPNKLHSFIAKNNECITAMLENDDNLFPLIKEFCLLEQKLLPKMFVWTNGITEIMRKHELNLSIKLSGSGGGGFLLGFAKAPAYESIKNDFNKAQIKIETLKTGNKKLVNI